MCYSLFQRNWKINVNPGSGWDTGDTCLENSRGDFQRYWPAGSTGHPPFHPRSARWGRASHRNSNWERPVASRTTRSMWCPLERWAIALNFHVGRTLRIPWLIQWLFYFIEKESINYSNIINFCFSFLRKKKKKLNAFDISSERCEYFRRISC